MSQLNLGFSKNEDFSKQSFFVSDSNKDALSWIDKWPEWPAHSIIIYGPESSGKTHLATIWKEKSGAEFFDSKGTNNKNIVIENIETITDEKELFHIFNSVKEAGKFLLLTSSRNPKEIQFKLKDLESRIRSIPAIQIKLPGDDLLKSVLVKQLSDRQLKVDKEVVNYVLSRTERSYSSIKNFIEEVDRFSLEEKRNITIPLVKNIL